MQMHGAAIDEAVGVISTTIHPNAKARLAAVVSLWNSSFTQRAG
jgi:hypothetical protein